MDTGTGHGHGHHPGTAMNRTETWAALAHLRGLADTDTRQMLRHVRDLPESSIRQLLAASLIDPAGAIT